MANDPLKVGQIVGCMDWQEPTLDHIIGEFKNKTALQILLELGHNFADGIIFTQDTLKHFAHPAHHTTHVMQIKALDENWVYLINQREKVKLEKETRSEFIAKMWGNTPKYCLFDLPVEIDRRWEEAANARDEAAAKKGKGFFGKILSFVTYDVGGILSLLISAVIGKKIPWFEIRGREVCSTFIASRSQCGFLAMGLPADTLLPGNPNTADYWPAHIWVLNQVQVG
jgi:hypothetical protein